MDAPLIPPADPERACALEPIHRLARIQRFGFLMAVDAQGLIGHVSDNAPAWIGGDAAADWLGQPAATCWSPALLQAVDALAERARLGGTVERLYDWPAQRGPRQGERLDLAMHYSDGCLVIEAEPALRDGDATLHALLHSHAARLLAAPDLVALWQEAVTAVAALTSFDRVMLYRFAPDGSGSVEAEALRPGITSMRGLRFPASDIPSQARALYLRSPSRIICDACDDGVALLARGHEPLDLSLSVLRSVSPVHLQYLRNMGTAASMSISLVVDGRLWGLIACHHLQALRPSHRRRSAAELIGALCAAGIARLEREADQQAIDATLLNPSLLHRLFGHATPEADRSQAMPELAQAMRATGVLLLLREGHQAWGETPAAAAWPALQARLQALPANEVTVLDSMAASWPEAAAWAPEAAGLLVLPVGTQPREWVLLFRREVLRDVLWAGNPEKAVSTDALGQPEPRRSFAAWRQQVRLHGEPWTPRERRLAQRLRAALLEGLLLHREQRQVDELRRADQQQRLLVRELNHRVRNLLGLINGLVWQSSRSATDVPQLRDTLQQRVQAMSRAHTQIEQLRWQPAPLQALLQAELLAFADPGQLRLEGPPLLLLPDAYFSLALIAHELATNARKYGALSRPEGRVAVHWRRGAQGELTLDWQEEGGPQVAMPSRRGFGSQVIEAAAAHELGGAAEVHFRPEGLSVRLHVPARHLADGIPGEPAAPTPGPAPRLPPFRPAHAVLERVLLLEDDLVIALLGEAMLRELGCAEVVVTGSAAAADAAIDAAPPDAAVLDVNLGDHLSDGVAARLQALGVPVVVASGYSDLQALPPALRDAAAHLAKPYTRDDLARALRAAGRPSPPPAT